MSSSATSSATATSTAPTPSATGNGNGGGGGSSSPLLFFVALGFGVVFTNLWIIVGVKYCFRYNQRNRALGRGSQVDGDPIDLTVMPRPHRRRREKKLMSLEDANTRFPLMKYKAWRSSREQEGLPAEGGITSRPASLKGVEDVIADHKLRTSIEHDRPGSSMSQTPRVTSAVESIKAKTIPEGEVLDEKSVVEIIESDEKLKSPAKVTTASTDGAHADHADESDDEADDPIAEAATPEMLNLPGDTCAICLDTLEDDDEVRGLTCGHAYHSACIDPWLTTRRASCPLCKADYYVPKSRPEGEQDAPASSRRGQRSANLPQAPRAAWLDFRPRGRMFANRGVDAREPSRTSRSAPEVQQQSWHLRPRMFFNNNTPATNNNNRSFLSRFRRNQATGTTPAQLEAATAR